METTATWYQNLVKPSFAPPAFAFGIAWSILYPIIFVSFGYAIFLVIKRKIPRIILIPLIFNLFFNFIFSYIQFQLQNNYLAAVDIVLVLATLIWFTKLVFPYSRLIAFAQIPYILWVSFATILQFSITWLNR